MARRSAEREDSRNVNGVARIWYQLILFMGHACVAGYECLNGAVYIDSRGELTSVWYSRSSDQYDRDGRLSVADCVSLVQSHLLKAGGTSFYRSR